MEKHLTFAVVLNIVYRSVILLGGLIVMVLGFSFEWLMSLVARIDPYEVQDVPEIVFEIVPVILFIIGSVIALFSVVTIIAAIAAGRRKEWGRILLLVMSFFNLIHVPLGTLVGAYTIWVLFNDEVIRMFNPAKTAEVVQQ